MRFAWFLAAAGLAILAAASIADAQYPIAGLTATGRSFTLTDPAWKVFIPSTYYQRPNQVADVIVHFHGDPQTYWNNAQWANLNAIIVTVNYSGLSSAYTTPFSNTSHPTAFQSVLDQALARVRAESDISDNLIWDKIAVSSFSDWSSSLDACIFRAILTVQSCGTRQSGHVARTPDRLEKCTVRCSS